MTFDSDPFELGFNIEDVECVRDLAKSLICIIDGEEVVVPKSQIHDDSEVSAEGDEGTLVVTEWLAEQRGWA